MAKSRPTEEDLGIEITPEEQAVLDRPAPEIIDDDIPSGDEADDLHQIAAPKPDGQPEKLDARKTREHAPDGKFAPKSKDDGVTPQPDPNKPPPGFVDNRALQEARAENKILMERMTTLLEATQRREAAKAKADEPAPEAPPDAEADPLGFIRHVNDRLGKLETETAQQKQAREAYEREDSDIIATQNQARPMLQEASASDPTLTPMYQRLYQSMAQEIAFNNSIDVQTATPEQLAYVKRETDKLEAAHIKNAFQRGVNVIDYMKRFAATRGITAQAEQQQTPAPDGKPQGKPIAERQQQQQRHQSLGDMSGAAAPTGISAKDIAKMTPKQFAAYAKSVGEEGLDDVFARA